MTIKKSDKENKDLNVELGFIKWFSKINKGMINSVGEKGASLGELFNKGFDIPAGFVITTQAYNSFLESSDLKKKIAGKLKEINLENDEQINSACSEIKGLILKSEFPEEVRSEIFEAYEDLGTDKLEIDKGTALDILNNASESIFVSVRSSLPFSSFGRGVREQNTYLNVKGGDFLLDHIKECYASLFNPKTIRRQLKSISPAGLAIAIVIQKMVNPEKSGVAYSRDSSDNIVVKAIWGIGEGLNIGGLCPDRYILSRELDILDKKIEEKDCRVVRGSGGELRKVDNSEERKIACVLNKYEIQKVADLAEKIEEHFGRPQEIEFAIDEDSIYVLQSREMGKSEGREERREMKGDEGKVGEVKKEVVHEKVRNVERVEKITKTKLKLILDSPHLVEEAVKTGLKKVGLIKLEKIIREGGKHPFYFLNSNYINEYENLVYRGIEKVASSFEEIWVRTSDFVEEDLRDLKGSPEDGEKNPLLGLHGIRFGLKYPDILEAELRALKRISDETIVGVLIPHIVSVEELKRVKEMLGKIGLENVKIGIVLETPASVQMIKAFCDEKIDVVLIESDDLIQHLLAVDKKNEKSKHVYHEGHPAFLYQLEYVLRVCKRNKVETNIFGEIVYNKEILSFLVKKGIDFVSVEPEEAKELSEEIYQIESEVLGGTDKEPRQYEIKKDKEEYLEKKEENKKEVGEKDDQHEELKEHPEEEFDEGVEKHFSKEKNENKEGSSEDEMVEPKKDPLGIF